MSKSENEDFSEEEAQQRFVAPVKAALNTPPKPLKDRPEKRKESKGGRSKGRRDAR
jgi:hypothetical protein